MSRDQRQKPAKISDLARMGFDLGKRCALAEINFRKQMAKFCVDQKLNNGLTVEGEEMFRAAFEKGLTLQRENPDRDCALKVMVIP